MTAIPSDLLALFDDGNAQNRDISALWCRSMRRRCTQVMIIRWKVLRDNLY